MDDSERIGRTQRLELADPVLRDFEAVVLAAHPDDGIVLDRSAFYPGGGGQPSDQGVLLWGGVQTRVVGARRADDLHLLAAEGDPLPPTGTVVRGSVDDERRTALMRTHSALHLLSGVVFRDFGALVTSSSMEPLTGRLDFDLETVPPGFRDDVEAACAIEIDADRAIVAYSLPREQALAIPDVIRTASVLLPADLEVVRLVDIDGLDVQPDGGTHVASTRMVRRLRVTKVENKGRGFRRIRVALES